MMMIMMTRQIINGSSIWTRRTGHLCALAGRTARAEKKYCWTSFFGRPARASGWSGRAGHPG